MSSVPERKTAVPRTAFTVAAYLAFTHHGKQASVESHAYDAETQARLRALLRYLRDHFDGVRSIRIYRHSLGGLIPTGRGSTVTQVFVEITRLAVMDKFREASRAPGALRDLVEAMRERLQACTTEILYEVPVEREEQA